MPPKYTPPKNLSQVRKNLPHHTAKRPLAAGRRVRKGRPPAKGHRRDYGRPWDAGWVESTIRFEEESWTELQALALSYIPRISMGEAVRIATDLGLEALKQMNSDKRKAKL